ncbi:MAG TPA: hypothetical protein ENH11_07990 [Candidatus Acetothermia bacterium]|nr:hypothetical protein [Candidatus Acetothermia bacterium]
MALDGRKIAGNASLEQNRDEEWLKEEVGKLLAEALERIEEKKRQAMVNQERMERKLLTKRGREAHKQRGSTIEPVFGQMVMRGLVRFMLRGSNKVRAE